jgi:hypothetical protein
VIGDPPSLRRGNPAPKRSPCSCSFHTRLAG